MFPHLSKRLSQDRHESQINFFIAVAHLYSLSTRRGTSQMKMLERRERTIIKHLSKQPVKWGAGGREGTFMTGMKRNLKLETFTMTFREVDTQQV